MKALSLKEIKKFPAINMRGLAIRDVSISAVKIDSEELEQLFNVRQGFYAVVSPNEPQPVAVIALTEYQLTSMFQFTN